MCSIKVYIDIDIILLCISYTGAAGYWMYRLIIPVPPKPGKKTAELRLAMGNLERSMSEIYGTIDFNVGQSILCGSCRPRADVSGNSNQLAGNNSCDSRAPASSLSADLWDGFYNVGNAPDRLGVGPASRRAEGGVYNPTRGGSVSPRRMSRKTVYTARLPQSTLPSTSGKHISWIARSQSDTRVTEPPQEQQPPQSQAALTSDVPILTVPSEDGYQLTGQSISNSLNDLQAIADPETVPSSTNQHPSPQDTATTAAAVPDEGKPASQQTTSRLTPLALPTDINRSQDPGYRNTGLSKTEERSVYHKGMYLYYLYRFRIEVRRLYFHSPYHWGFRSFVRNIGRRILLATLPYILPSSVSSWFVSYLKGHRPSSLLYASTRHLFLSSESVTRDGEEAAIANTSPYIEEYRYTYTYTRYAMLCCILYVRYTEVLVSDSLLYNHNHLLYYTLVYARSLCRDIQLLMESDERVCGCRKLATIQRMRSSYQCLVPPVI